MRKFITDILAKANLGVEQNAYVLGTVGIGTATPSYKLDVNGVTRFQDIVRFKTNAWNLSDDGYNRFYFSPNGRTYFGAGGGYEWRSAADITLAVITDAGNVGIGTSSPGWKLDVVGDVRASSYFVGGSSGQGFSWGNFTYGSYIDVDNSQNALRIRNTSGTIMLEVNGGSNYFTGNLGIGTTSPGTKLQIDDTSSPTIRLNASSVSGGAGSLQFYNQGVQKFNLTTVANSNDFGLYNNGGTNSFNLYIQHADGNATFSSTIAATGATFTGAGSSILIVRSTSASGYATTDYFNSSNSQVASFGYGNASVGAAPVQNAAYIYTAPGIDFVGYMGGGERLRIASTGAATFSSSVNATTIGAGSGTNQAYLGAGFLGFYNAASSAKYIKLTDDASTIDAIGFSKSGSASTTWFPSGNVGIGTTSPQTFLTLNGANVSYAGQLQIASNNFAQISFYNSAALTPGASNRKSSIIYNIGSNTFELANQITSGALVLQGSDSGGGNVGIGTDNPGYKLDVNGTGRFSGTLRSNDHEIKNSANSETLDLFLSPSVLNAYIDYPTSRSLNFRNKSTGVSLTLASTGEATFSSSVTSSSYYASNGGFFGWGDSSTRVDGDSSNQYIRAVINNSEKLRIVSNGIGIGTTSPSTYGANLAIIGSGNGIIAIGQGTSYTTLQSNGQDFYLNMKGSGSTVFRNGSGDTERMRIDSSGNVGIGTTSPGARLHVEGGNAIFNNGLADTILAIETDAAGLYDPIFQMGSGQNSIAAEGFEIWYSNNVGDVHLSTTYSNAAASIRFHTATGTSKSTSNERMIITGTGNVGIGTTSPSNLLHLYGTDGNSYLRWTSDVATTGTRIGYNGTEFRIDQQQNADVTIRTNGSERMRITSGGNVLIGTTTDDGYKLNVNGSIKSQGILFERSPYETRSIGLDSSGWYFYNNSDSRYDMLIDTNGNVGIGTSPATRLNIYGVDPIFRMSTADNSMDIKYTTSGGGSAQRISIGAGASTEHLVVLNSGNVGIGTTSPGLKLDIVSGTTLYPVLRLQNTDTNGYSGAHLYSSAGTLTGHFGWANGSSTALSDKMYFGTIANKPVVFTTNDSEKVRIAADGNVGIGTNYTDNLISGTERVLKISNSNIASIYLESVGNGVWANYINSARSLVWYDITADAERMRITSAGNIGVNTTNPYAGTGVTSVTINASSYPILAFQNNGSRTGEIIGYYNHLALNTPGFIALSPGDSEAMRITTGGNVGIGTTSPGVYKLSITSSDYRVMSLNSTYGQMNMDFANSGVSFASIGSGNSQSSDAGITASDFGIGTVGSATNKIIFATGTGYSTRMVILPSGNVGIGTTSPSEKLESVGIIKSSGSTNSLMFENRSAAGNTWEWYSQGSVGSSFAGLYKNYNTAGTVLAITDTGNVGIGTTSPSDELTVNSAGNSTGIAIQRSGVTKGLLEIGSSSDTFAISATSATGLLGFNTNSTERMRIASDGNVGIGTTNPSRKLTVQGADDGTMQLRLMGTASQTSYWEIGREAASTGQFRFIASRNGSVITPMVIDDVSGNVGIGTASPAYKLHVYNNTNGFISRFTGGVSSDVNIGIFGFTGLFGSIGTESNHPLNIFTNGTDRMTISTSGNVGIGTTSPFTKFHVSAGYGLVNNGYSWAVFNSASNGFAAQFGAADDVAFASTGNNAIISATGSNAILFGTNSTERMRITSGGNVGIGTTTPGTPLGGAMGLVIDGNANGDVQIRIQANSTGRTPTDGGLLSISGTAMYLWNYENDALYFGTNNTARVTINSSGNVGIGTTSPTGKLTISQNNSGGVAALTFTEDESTIQGPSANTKILMGGNLSLNAASTWIAGTNGSERMRITSSGNVGIGTANPNGYASSGRTILSLNGSSNTMLEFKVGDVSRGYIYRDSRLEIYDENRIDLSTNTAVRTTILSNGNVGIGITNPGHKLHVVGAVGIGQNTNGTATIDAYGGKAYYGCDGTQITVTGNNGNVGIGTTTPGYKLEVAGTSYFSGLAHFGQTAATGSAFRWGAFGTAVSSDTMLCHNQLYNGSGWTILDSSVGTSYMNLGGQVASPDIQFGTGGANTPATTKMTILNSGNVGIGTTSPSYKLHVEGNTSGISIYASHDIAAFSDITVKKEVKRIENAIEKVKELNGYTYVRTDDETGTRRAGVIAQEVQKVLPEVVSANPDGTLNVAYSNMIALLIEGMKEQQATIEKLQSEINELKK
jgi:hypothetical protein